MPKGRHDYDLTELQKAFEKHAESEKQRWLGFMEPATICGMVEIDYERIAASLQGEGDDWKRWIPGRPLLKQFASRAKVDLSRLKNVFIREATKASEVSDQEGAVSRMDPFAEIRAIFAAFSK